MPSRKNIVPKKRGSLAKRVKKRILGAVLDAPFKRVPAPPSEPSHPIFPPPPDGKINKNR